MCGFGQCIARHLLDSRRVANIDSLEGILNEVIDSLSIICLNVKGGSTQRQESGITIAYLTD